MNPRTNIRSAILPGTISLIIGGPLASRTGESIRCELRELLILFPVIPLWRANKHFMWGFFKQTACYMEEGMKCMTHDS